MTKYVHMTYVYKLNGKEIDPAEFFKMLEEKINKEGCSSGKGNQAQQSA